MLLWCHCFREAATAAQCPAATYVGKASENLWLSNIHFGSRVLKGAGSPNSPKPSSHCAGGEHENGSAPPKTAPEANFGLSGKLAEETNTVRGVVLLHQEPPEARKPGLRWRLYTFKNGAHPNHMDAALAGLCDPSCL